MADSKLSALTEATTLGGTDELYVNDSGTSKRITYASLLALLAAIHPSKATTNTFTLANTFSEVIVGSKGLKFPASQVASADASTLDDYEEGTWTPVLTPATGAITTQLCSGTYTKTGNRVSVSMKLATPDIGTASGVIALSGLPFVHNADLSCVGRYAATGNLCVLHSSDSGSSTGQVWRYDNAQPFITSAGVMTLTGVYEG